MYLKLIIKKLAKIVCIVLTVFMAHAALAAPNMIAGYYRELSIYLRSYFPADIPVEKLTHVIHAFIDVTGNGDAYSCTAVDPFALYEKVDYRFPDYGKGIINQMKYLRDKSGRNNDLKLIFSIGGQVRSAQFASATSSSLRRANFAHSCVSFMRQHGYDGLDFDWEFQETREQGVNYKALLDEVRRQMDEAESIDRKQYQLGVTVGVHPDAYNTLPLENFADSVDWVGIMSYNYTLPTRDQTGHNAPLYASSKNLIPSTKL